MSRLSSRWHNVVELMRFAISICQSEREHLHMLHRARNCRSAYPQRHGNPGSHDGDMVQCEATRGRGDVLVGAGERDC
jgi:hypothetical protein